MKNVTAFVFDNCSDPGVAILTIGFRPRLLIVALSPEEIKAGILTHVEFARAWCTP